ncbi:MAG: nucleotidyltransferase substrate binding protein [Candidatus Babeliaceae bacterium]|nr:nucleotidyltransferase substrate binding protein [Candidatus Babeliaceae bacterium]
MEKLTSKLLNLNKMVKALEKSIDMLQKTNPEEVEFIQDSVIARFKILIESTWKDIKIFLEYQKFADVPSSPKGVIHFAKEVNFLTDQEYSEFSKYLVLRNLASYIYDAPQYLLAIQAAPHAVELVKKIINRIESPLHF